MIANLTMPNYAQNHRQWVVTTARLLGYKRVKLGPIAIGIIAPSGEVILEGGPHLGVWHLAVQRHIFKTYGIRYLPDSAKTIVEDCYANET